MMKSLPTPCILVKRILKGRVEVSGRFQPAVLVFYYLQPQISISEPIPSGLGFLYRRPEDVGELPQSV